MKHVRYNDNLPDAVIINPLHVYVFLIIRVGRSFILHLEIYWRNYRAVLLLYVTDIWISPRFIF